MTHGSLFSGIGGFDLASDWMGWDNKFHCEWNEFGQQILNYYWPQAKSYGDITTTDFTIWNGKIDILTGGFPCQPYSQAGKRRGKEDERHLWPEMLRAIKEIEPRWIVGENVYGIVNWNGGMVFNEVQTQLEDEGYSVQPYVLPAAGVNAPHQRYRVWFVANSVNCGYKAGCGKEKEKDRVSKISRPEMVTGELNGSSVSRTTTHSDGAGLQKDGAEQQAAGFKQHRELGGNASNSGNQRLQGCEVERSPERSRKERHKQPAGRFRTDWKKFPTQSPVCSGDDWLSARLDGITFPKWRNESIKGYGNAIVPQVAFQIFKAIEKYDSKNSIRTEKVPGSTKVSKEP